MTDRDKERLERLSPEAKEVLELFANRVQLSLANLELSMADRSDKFRRELTQELRRVADEQVKQGLSLAKIEERLDEGDKKFDKMDERLTTLEGEQNKAGRGLAYLAGAATGGGAVGAALARLFGS